MKRVAREVEAAMREAFPGATVIIQKGRKHYKVTVIWRGRKKTHPFGGSPTVPEHAVWNTVASVRKALEQGGGWNGN